MSKNACFPVLAIQAICTHFCFVSRIALSQALRRCRLVCRERRVAGERFGVVRNLNASVIGIGIGPLVDVMIAGIIFLRGHLIRIDVNN